MEGFFQILPNSVFYLLISLVFIEKHNLLCLVLVTLIQALMARETYQTRSQTGPLHMKTHSFLGILYPVKFNGDTQHFFLGTEILGLSDPNFGPFGHKSSRTEETARWDGRCPQQRRMSLLAARRLCVHSKSVYLCIS